MRANWDRSSSQPKPQPEIDPTVQRAAEGDHQAFETLFRQHAPWVYGRLRRMLGARADLDDLVQEVFIRAFRSLPSYRGQARFESWLRRICARVAYDEIRAIKSSPRLELVDSEPRGGERTQDIEKREAVRHMMRIIETLPTNNRVVLLLHDVEGYTAEEIRLVIGVKSVNTVRSRLRLARAELHRRARAHPALGWMYQDQQR